MTMTKHTIVRRLLAVTCAAAASAAVLIPTTSADAATGRGRVHITGHYSHVLVYDYHPATDTFDKAYVGAGHWSPRGFDVDLIEAGPGDVLYSSHAEGNRCFGHTAIVNPGTWNVHVGRHC